MISWCVCDCVVGACDGWQLRFFLFGSAWLESQVELFGNCQGLGRCAAFWLTRKKEGLDQFVVTSLRLKVS